jgi:integrase
MSAPREQTKTPGIYKRGGRYSFTYRDNRGQTRWGSAATMAEAKATRASLTADVARGEYRALSRVSFADYAAEWIASYQGRTSRGLREQTRRDYRRALGLDADGNVREDNGAAVAYFGRRRLAEIEPRDIKTYLAEVAERKHGDHRVSRDTVRLALAPLRALFATAVEEGLIRSNPATGIRLPNGTEPEAEQEGPKALSEEELAALLDAADDRWRLLFAFLAQSGLRISEAVALTWNDVDFGRKRAQVRRRFHKGQMGPPKSRYGRRDVPLSPGMAKALWERRKAASGDDAPVFSGERGMIDASTAFRALRSAANEAGVPWAGLHTLRHTCATILFKRGLNAKQVQVWLGHHSPAFTLATYVHLLSDDLPQADFLDEVASAERADDATEQPARTRAVQR